MQAISLHYLKSCAVHYMAKIFQMLPHCFIPWLTQERRLNSFWCLTVMSTSSQAIVPDNLLRVPGTMAIHQLVTHEPYKIASRVVGCLCENDLMCSCYNTNRFQFPTQEHTHQSATEVDAESDTPPENLHEDQSAREVDAESNTRPENLHEDQSATEVDAESDTPPENLHEDQSAREVDAESNTPPENLHEDWNKLHPISGPAPGITGKWCAILYEGCIYPGIIQQSNSNQVEVQAMMKVGKNRYKWPIKDDVLWYDYDEVVSLIPAPKPVTKRQVQIEPTLWSMIVDVVDRSQ